MTEEFYDGKTVKVGNLNDQFEADMLRDILQERGIVAIFRPYEDLPYGDLFVTDRGWGGLWVPPEAKEEAEQLLEELRADNSYLIDDEELTEEALAAEPDPDIDEMDKDLEG